MQTASLAVTPEEVKNRGQQCPMRRIGAEIYRTGHLKSERNLSDFGVLGRTRART